MRPVQTGSPLNWSSTRRGSLKTFPPRDCTDSCSNTCCTITWRDGCMGSALGDSLRSGQGRSHPANRDCFRCASAQ